LNNSNSLILPFAKMQALGNDFIVLDGEALLASKEGAELIQGWTKQLPALAQQLCGRRFGIGADGLVLALNLKCKEMRALAVELYGEAAGNCQLAWTITNSDGSTPETCANALRCLALWAHRKELITDRCRVITKAGVVEIAFSGPDAITIDLGEPALSAEKIPYAGGRSGHEVVNQRFELGFKSIPITCVNMGNPHCVTFAKELFEKEKMHVPYVSEQEINQFPPHLLSIAYEIQADSRFPESANVSFALARERTHAEALVVERGCGPTLACGSAAAAILVAGVLEERLERRAKVSLPGGVLLVDWSVKDNHVRITGSARLSFNGQVEINMASPRPSINNSASAKALGAKVR
jgi:diaminopimelate epimerase